MAQPEFKASTTNAGPLLEAVKMLEGFADKGIFRADKDGLRFRSMDPSHSAMIDLFIPSQYFYIERTKKGSDSYGTEKIPAYSCTGSVLICVPLEPLKRALKSMQGGWRDTIVFEKTGSCLTVQQLGSKEDLSYKRFDIPLMDLEEGSEGLEKEVKISGAVTVKTDYSLDFSKGIAEASAFSEEVDLSLVDKGRNKALVIKAKGEMGTVEILRELEGQLQDSEEDITLPINSSYSSSWLKKISGQECILSFGNEQPIKTINSFGYGEHGITITCWLAPYAEAV